MVRPNALAAKWEGGGSVVGAWCSLGSPFAAELSASAGYDYVCVDIQHGLSYVDALPGMLMAVSRTPACPIVRVPAIDAGVICKALDFGAAGVIVPMVNGREDAERAVAACRYAPAGVRSFGPTRASLFLDASDPMAMNDQVLCIVMIETVEAVEKAEEICTTPGVDAVYIGPADLALSMGMSPTAAPGSTEHADALERVRTTCTSFGVPVGIHTTGGEQARRCLDVGFSMVTLGTDAALLRSAVAAQLALARG